MVSVVVLPPWVRYGPVVFPLSVEQSAQIQVALSFYRVKGTEGNGTDLSSDTSITVVFSGARFSEHPPSHPVSIE